MNRFEYFKQKLSNPDTGQSSITTGDKVEGEDTGLLKVNPSSGLRGTVTPPGDKSISHRSLMLACLADGPCEIDGISTGDDVIRTAMAMVAMGALISSPTGSERVVVHGTGGELSEPTKPLDLGNSGTGFRLMLGLVAGREGLFVLTGDRSLSSRPMDRVIRPLSDMGAVVDGRAGGKLAPVVIRGSRLKGIDYTVPVPSAQVKSAILLAGLNASGPTTIREAHKTRPHTEELLKLCGVSVESADFGNGGGSSVTVFPGKVSPFSTRVPGDPSQAAFWVVAGLIVPGSDLLVESVYLGPERSGFVSVLKRMGADITVEGKSGETADLRVRTSSLTATTVDAEEIPSLDEVPILAVAAAFAKGISTFKGLAELRVKESDRLATVASELTALGANVEVIGDDMRVTGGRITGGHCRSHGDHRIAMACAIAGLAGNDVTSIHGWDAVATSYPEFVSHLAAIGASFQYEELSSVDDGPGISPSKVASRPSPNTAASDARHSVLAIDGPSGSGKSTIAREVAKMLGMAYLDTGAMYRAVGCLALRREVKIEDQDALEGLVRGLTVKVEGSGPGQLVTVDSEDVSDEIRTEETTSAASKVAAHPAVRKRMVELQRIWADDHGGGVVEGRDIGSVVFPEARLKVYLTADAQVRAARRAEEEGAGPGASPLGAMLERDERDRTRTDSPLTESEDSVKIDTSSMGIAEVTKVIVELWNKRTP